MNDDELAALRRKRLQQLQEAQAQRRAEAGYAQQAEAEAAAAEAEAQKEALLRQILTPDARERVARLRMARPEDARVLEQQLIGLAQSGRLQAQIDDEQLRALLARLFPANRDIKIRRK